MQAVLDRRELRQRRPAVKRHTRQTPYHHHSRPVYTYRDYAGWPEDLRAEIINGEVYFMAAPSIRHQKIVIRLSSKLLGFVEGTEAEALNAPVSVRLFPRYDNTDEYVFEPDVVLVCDPSKIGYQSINGAPDFIAEILSPSTAVYDLNLKFEKYEEAGVREYWIIDPEAETVQAHVLQDGVYSERLYTADETIALSVLPDCAVNLSSLFA